eukprot:479525-Pyramimonas_sp.AAC.1
MLPGTGVDGAAIMSQLAVTSPSRLTKQQSERLVVQSGLNSSGVLSDSGESYGLDPLLSRPA